MSNAIRSGQTLVLDEDCLNALIHENPRQTTRELAEEMECDHSTIVRHLKAMGKVQKLGAWVPHALTQNNKDCRAIISASLLARHRLARQQHQPFLSRIITGDEKWCLYINFKERKEWLSLNKQATPRAKKTFILGRPCFACGGIKKVLFTTSCFLETKQSQPNFIVSNLSDLKQRLRRKNEVK